MTQANAVMQDACRSEFMMVGHGSHGRDRRADARGLQHGSRCGLHGSPDAANGPMSYQGVPFPVDIANASAWFQMGEMHPT